MKLKFHFPAFGIAPCSFPSILLSVVIHSNSKNPHVVDEKENRLREGRIRNSHRLVAEGVYRFEILSLVTVLCFPNLSNYESPGVLVRIQISGPIL